MADELKRQNKQIAFRLNINMLVVGLLSILIFVSIIQTVTLASLFTKKQAVTDSGTTTSVGKSNLPAALKDIPQQVGGC